MALMDSIIALVESIIALVHSICLRKIATSDLISFRTLLSILQSQLWLLSEGEPLFVLSRSKCSPSSDILVVVFPSVTVSA